MERDFVVLGGLWFDKVNGNTYNVAKILDIQTGEFHYTDFTYGYENAYMDEAASYINNVLTPGEYNLVFNMGSVHLPKKVLKSHLF